MKHSGYQFNLPCRLCVCLATFMPVTASQNDPIVLLPGESTGPMTPSLQIGPDTQTSDTLAQGDALGGNRLRLGIGVKRHQTFASGSARAQYDIDIPYAFRFVADPSPTAFPGLPKLHPDLASLIRTGSSTQVDEREPFEPRATPLSAQVSGQFDLRGYMALLGVGQVKAVVSLSVRDLGIIDGSVPGPSEQGTPVAGMKLFERELTASFTPSLGLDFALQAGSDFEGMSTAVNAAFDVSMQKLNILENNLEFSLEALLRRGHRYRFILTLEASTGMHAVGLGLGDEQNAATGDARIQGKAIAAFKYDAGSPTSIQTDEFDGVNLMQRWNEIWLQHDYKRHHLRNICFPSGIPLSFFLSTNDALRYLLDDPDDTFPLHEPLLNDYSILCSSPSDPYPPNNPSALHGLDGLAHRYFPSTDTSNTAVAPPGSEGLTIDHFSVLIEDDLKAAADRAYRRQIESSLVNNGDLGLLTLLTPDFTLQNQDPWNGSYLLVRDVVLQAVNGYLSSGIERSAVEGALRACTRKEIGKANRQADAGNYREAFSLLRQAYGCVYVPNPIDKARYVGKRP